MRVTTHSSGVRISPRRLSWAALAALCAIALLLSNGHRPALAGPATLTTPQNPVGFLATESTKLIKLNYSVDPNGQFPTATLTFGEKGGPVTFSNVVQGTGEKTVLVAYGKTYVAQLNDPLGVLVSLEITTARRIVIPQIGLKITQSTVEPHGTFAAFDIKTSRTALMLLKASTKQPNAAGEWSNQADVVSSVGTLLPVSAWKPNLLDLKPDTTYYWSLKADEGQDSTDVKTGSFRTLKRRIAVDYDTIVLVDDSDDLGDCECLFSFRAGGNGPKLYSHPDFATGGEKNPNVQFTFGTASDSLQLSARGADDDYACDVFWVNCLNPCPTGDVSAGNGVTDCYERSEAKATYTLETGLGEAYSQAFELVANGGNDSSLRFKVRGTFTVSYVP
jgi:hypothetical protein